MKKLFFLSFICVLITGCSPKLFNKKWITKPAPTYFKARFETTQGNFDIEAKREWSPKGVDRLHQLIKNGFYTDIAVFRVVPNFVAQFGIHNNKNLSKEWGTHKIDDEIVVKSNEEMTISFARAGKRTRTTQIFINLRDNSRLDKIDYGGVKGFPVVAQVINGKENVEKFYNGYGEKITSKQDSITKYGNDFLKRKFPKVDYIIKAYILK